MYCFKCGKQIHDDSAFCRYCGTSQKLSMEPIHSTPMATVQSCNRELDRTALKTHLFNILSLEYMKNKLSNDYLHARNQLSYIPNNENIYRKIIIRRDRARSAHFLYDGTKHYIAFDMDKIHAFVQDSFKGYSYYWKAINEEDRYKLHDEQIWKYVGDEYDGFFERSGRIKEARDIAIDEFRSFIKESVSAYPGYRNKTINNRNYWTKIRNNRKSELDQVTNLLNQTYSINIIPEPYRGEIHAIYYLHSFISTSAESFSSALLHLDLEQIKQQLGTIIAQNETIILQQAHQISQNNKIIEQNNRQLKYLADISVNAEQAAEYSSIAARNSEICAWFASAQYFKEK